MSVKDITKTSHYAIISGVIGAVLTAHGAKPAQTIASVVIGIGIYKLGVALIQKRK